jgi:hypothetical protein
MTPFLSLLHKLRLVQVLLVVKPVEQHHRELRGTEATATVLLTQTMWANICLCVRIHPHENTLYSAAMVFGALLSRCVLCRGAT